MSEHFTQRVEHLTISFSTPIVEEQIDRFASAATDIARNQTQRLEDSPQRQHASASDLEMQTVGDRTQR